jgi:hypothetical protein
VNPENYSLDYAQESQVYQAVFIHELTHILQFQQGNSVLMKGAILQMAYYLSLKRYNPYAYTLKSIKHLQIIISNNKAILPAIFSWVKFLIFCLIQKNNHWRTYCGTQRAR